MEEKRILEYFKKYLNENKDSVEFNFSKFPTKKMASEYVEFQFFYKFKATDAIKTELQELREQAISIDLFEKSNGQTLQGKKINKIKNK